MCKMYCRKILQHSCEKIKLNFSSLQYMLIQTGDDLEVTKQTNDKCHNLHRKTCHDNTSKVFCFLRPQPNAITKITVCLAACQNREGALKNTHHCNIFLLKIFIFT